ncbi:hypothetical protein MSAN_00837800 [Mycena sanguinolenta]|uniref:F-box domain-containing protein n=1 Tax=Mycena sanguinolenta TaxID=230812 RepID=A0A8H6YYR2_9AGAR|nr:hypothetical protein MSAN_00837800 [Mycena sanguinolenta]
MFDDSDRLGTNYVPSEEEIKDLRGLLVDPVEQLAKILKFRPKLTKWTCSLTSSRYGEIPFKPPSMHTGHSFLQCGAFPTMSSGEIFAACLPTEHNALIDLAEAPLLLGRICRRWRAVSYSTPMLWSSIHIAPLRPPWANERSVDFFPQLKPVIQQWFERAVTCPLTVSLVEASSYASDPDTHPISILRNFSHQFRHLSLAGDPRLLLPPLRLGPESLPVLKSIAIYNDTNRRYPFGIEHPEALNLLQIPTLTDISLRVMVDPLSLPLNWSQLTHLDIRCFPPTRDSGLDGVGALELL